MLLVLLSFWAEGIVMVNSIKCVRGEQTSRLVNKLHLIIRIH